MALTIKTETLKATTNPTFEALRNRYSHRSSDIKVAVDPLCLSRDDLNELYRHVVVMEVKNRRALESPIITALEGDFDKPVSSFRHSVVCYYNYLKSNRIDGWTYRRSGWQPVPRSCYSNKEVKSEKTLTVPITIVTNQLVWVRRIFTSKRFTGTSLPP